MLKTILYYYHLKFIIIQTVFLPMCSSTRTRQLGEEATIYRKRLLMVVFNQSTEIYRQLLKCAF